MKHLQAEQVVTLELTFNQQEYMLVSEELSLEVDYRFYLDIPGLNTSASKTYSEIMKLQSNPGTCPLGSTEPGGRFVMETPT